MRYCPGMADRKTAPPFQRVTFTLRLAALLAWAAAIAWLSLAAEVKAPSGILGWDKLNHFAAYALLTLLLVHTLRASCTPPAHLLVISWLICCSWGLMLEGLQWYMGAGRLWEAGDLLANALGALAACVLFRQIRGRSCQHER